MKKKQAVNPYLPENVYIPDGEPHVFGDRLYIFGSHDKEGGEAYCMLDYEVWSAPVQDLADWTNHGVSYRISQDPLRGEQYSRMYAPDVVQGNDGKYYLYYALSGTAFTSPIHVAAADRPEGPYSYLGEVRNADGTVFDRNVTFDPAVLNDDGIIRLYYGWAIAAQQFADLPAIAAKAIAPMIRKAEKSLLGKTEQQIRREKDGIQGAFTVTLADDMLTVTSEPCKIAPGQLEAKNTKFEGHGFFEGSSIRKIKDLYYFVYSSEVNHELCYAVSRYPDKDFVYGGVIISNGDIGYQGRRPAQRTAFTGNNHGGMVCVEGQWYIFYHRQTHKTSFSRQGCAEKIEISPDGSISQVEMTSCGLNHGPLAAEGAYPAVIACNVTNGRMPHASGQPEKGDIPYITHEGEEHLIVDITEGTTIGFKYFAFSGKIAFSICGSAEGKGQFDVYLDTEKIGEIALEEGMDLKDQVVKTEQEGVYGLYLKYTGSGRAKLKRINFMKL